MATTLSFVSQSTSLDRRRIYLSVAEASADMHAAALLRAVGERWPHTSFEGLTGPRTRELGAATIFDMSAHAAMLGGALKVLGKGLAAVNASLVRWGEARPDLVLLVDSPELNLPLAKQAQRQGIPVLYYVAPQTWASREYRVRAMRRTIDRLACILPFEESYFLDHGVRAAYVGHPLFESLRQEAPKSDVVERLRGHDGVPLIALLPGSRRHVIGAMLPKQLAVLAELRHMRVDFRASVSVASSAANELVSRIVAEHGYRFHGQRAADAQPVVLGHADGNGPSEFALDRVVEDNASLLTAADLVLVASGTATLHAAAYRKPMIVMYDAGWLFGGGYRWLGRWIVHTPHLSLVNILAGRRLVPEFMPSVPSPIPVARVARELLRDADWRRQMVDGIDAVVRPLESTRPSERVCDLMAELL